MRAFQPELLDVPIQNSTAAIDFGEATAEDRGAIFTKKEVVDFILDLVGWTKDKDLSDHSLLEPSFGGGEFLNAALQRYLDSSSQKDSDTLRDRFFGIEVNRASFEATSQLLSTTLTEAGFEESESNELVSGWLRLGDFLLLPINRQFTHIVGNPPYLRQESIPSELLAEYRIRYSTMYDRADLYVPFFERSMLLLQQGGKNGFICSDRWMKNKYGGPLRSLVSLDCHLDAYIDFTGCPAFHDEVVAYPAVTLIRRGTGRTTKAAYRPEVSAQTLSALIPALRDNAKHPDVFAADGVLSDSNPWILERFDRLKVIREMESHFPLLEEAGCKVGIGVATGADKVFIGRSGELDVEPERQLPLVTTRDIASGEIVWGGLSVLNPFDDSSSQVVDLKRFPKFEKYIEKHRALIENRHVAKKNPKSWFKTIDRIYPDLTHTPKLLIPDIKGSARVVYDEGSYYPHHNLYFITSSDWDLEVLQKIITSRIGEAFVHTYSVRMRGDFLRYQAQYLRRIRLPLWSDVSKPMRKILREGSPDEVDDAIRRLYSLDKASWKALAA